MLSQLDEPMENETSKTSSIPEFVKACLPFHYLSGFGRFFEPKPPFNGLVSNGIDQPNLKATRLLSVDPNVAFLVDVLIERNSSRQFGMKQLDTSELLQILWCAGGITRVTERGEHRTTASAGGLYPVKQLVFCRNVSDLSYGIYEFSETEVSLKKMDLHLEDDLETLFRTEHVEFENVSAIIFWVGNLLRICPKYGDRGYRYLLLEIGHIAQNACLAATALKIPNVLVGGFDDDKTSELLGLRFPWENTCYSMILGNKHE